MPSTNFQLIDSLFVHHKSRIYLHVQGSTKLSFQEFPCDVILIDLQSSNWFRYWVPRGQRFRLSFSLHFHERIQLVTQFSKPLTAVVADYVERAELWKELGYEVSQSSLTQSNGTSCHRSCTVVFDIRCIEYEDNSTLDCPISVPSLWLESVHLNLNFKDESITFEAESSSTSSRQCSCDAALKVDFHSVKSTLGFGWIDQPVQSAGVFEQKDLAHGETQIHLSLDEDVLLGLLDAGLRSCICPRPMHLAAGVKKVHENLDTRLCDLAPNIFSPTYTQIFEEQMTFLPGLTSILTSFASHLQSGGNLQQQEDLMTILPSYGDKSDPQNKPRESLRRHLWMTLANGIRNHTSVRRLTPLWSTRQQLDPTRSLESTRGLGVHMIWETLDEEGLSLRRDQIGDPSSNISLEINIFTALTELDVHHDFSSGCISGVTSKRVSEGHDATAGAHCDVVSRCGEQDGEDINNFPLEANNSDPPNSESRSRTQSFSHRSDVSMLMTPVRLTNNSREASGVIGPPSLIGTPKPLTQDVIRLHPLRQHEQDSSVVHPFDRGKNGGALYEKTASERVGHTPSGEDLQENAELFDCFSILSAREKLDSSPCITDRELISSFQDALYDSAKDDHLLDVPILPMSKGRNEQPTDSSLSDVLGNDHLLWHMWKRRASVAPRGEEDVQDMRTLFESDPDMKLFGKGWSLDPSDISSSSNEDPMLHDVSPHSGKPKTPGSPMSDRRSYLGITRSSSSSSSGQQSSDSKFQRRGSLIKRFSWGGRQHAAELTGFEMTNLNGRDFEVKRRRTMDDYETIEKEARSDDSNEMLF